MIRIRSVRIAGPPRRRHPLGALLAVVMTAGTLLAVPAVASADPSLGHAQQRAAALRADVDRLQVAAESATEDYDAAQDELGTLVARRILAQQQLDALRARFQSDTSIVDDRVRALYMTGGPAGMLNSLLEAHDLTDMVDRVYTVSDLVDDGQAQAATTDAAAQRAAVINADLARLATQQAAAQKKAGDAAARVRDALAQRRSLLAAADADVRRIADEQRRAAELAAQQAFALQLAAARSAGSGAAGAPSPVAAAAVAAARTRIGLPYVWGATGPDTFDCSGLTGWAYRQAGLSLPRTSRQQWYAGPHVDLGALLPGDLLFWATSTSDPATIHHVAIYAGNGLMIAAPEPGDVVKLQPVYLTGYIGAVRPTGSNPA